MQWILVLVVTTTLQALGKELLEPLGLTSEVRKALKLSVKFMTDDKLGVASEGAVGVGGGVGSAAALSSRNHSPLSEKK